MENLDYIDIHTHMDEKVYKDNRNDIIKKYFQNCKGYLITIADPCSEESIKTTIDIAESFENVYFMTAIHPHTANLYTIKVEKEILLLANHNKFLGIGEAGLDFHYNFSSIEHQVKVFSRQISIANELNFPILLHTRKAENKVLNILLKQKVKTPVIFHCYTGNYEISKKIIQEGYFLSFSGILTFKKANELRTIFQETPVNRIFLETDSPYLSPEPFRGKPNSPTNIDIIYKMAAICRKIELKEIVDTINSNFISVFKTIKK